MSDSNLSRKILNWLSVSFSFSFRIVSYFIGMIVRSILPSFFTSQFPVPRTIKPSGFMFNDYSFLQIDQTLAWSGDDKKLYLLKYSYHYGRTYLNAADRVQEERYHFRYEKESDYEYKNGAVNYLNFKPMHHFHGNSKDPHFKEPSQPKDIEEIIESLSINLSRLQKRYGTCSFLHLPAV
jgi:hypothetical protein